MNSQAKQNTFPPVHKAQSGSPPTRRAKRNRPEARKALPAGDWLVRPAFGANQFAVSSVMRRASMTSASLVRWLKVRCKWE
ncbi:hypothetical protein JCM15519_33500 [Fundidesulfovibrio butyratiphilus]